MSILSRLTLFTLLVTTSLVSAQVTIYEQDAAHTSVHFAANHADVGYTYGRFDEMESSLQYDSENPEASSFTLTIIVDSVNTNNNDRDDHLRSPDFFNSRQFPTIDFVSKDISQLDESTFEVTGDLSMHGVTQSITIPVTLTGTGVSRQGKALIGLHSEFEIDRTDFAMTNLRLAEGGPVGDTIKLIVSFEGVAR